VHAVLDGEVGDRAALLQVGLDEVGILGRCPVAEPRLGSDEHVAVGAREIERHRAAQSLDRREKRPLILVGLERGRIEEDVVSFWRHSP
jgi:hypothetical protein